MDIITLLVWLAVGIILLLVVLYLLNQLPLDPQIRQIINIALVVIVAVLVIWVLLRVTGVAMPR